MRPLPTRCRAQLGTELEPSTLHVFVIQNAEDARTYAHAYAGKQCERQLLVVEEQLSELAAFASIKLGDSFAYDFTEAFAGKLAKLAHTSASGGAAMAV